MSWQEKHEEESYMLNVVYAIDFLFLVDIIIIFNSSYFDEDYETVTDRKLIAKKYLKGWFAIDFFAIFPFDFFTQGHSHTSEYSDFIRVARIGRMYKLLKLARLLRILKILKERSKILRYLREFLQIGIGFERVTIFLCSFLMLCHIITCLWVFATQFVAEEELSWIVGGDFGELDTADRYLVSLYFTITTITTVGYGDISATNATER